MYPARRPPAFQLEQHRRAGTSFTSSDGYRRINWFADLAPRLEARFRETAAHAQAAGFHENLYVHVDRERRTAQLFLGQHPVWVSLDGKEFDVEGGAALVASQHANGSVAFFLYPYESEAAKRPEKLIVWRVFDDPLDVTDSVITRVIRDFASYWRVSSVLDGGSAHDRRRIARLIQHDEFRSPRNVAEQMDREDAIEGMPAQRSVGAMLSKLLQWWPFTLAAIFFTVIGGWQSTFDQIGKWWHTYVAPVDPAAAVPGMPVVTGYYTFCPDDSADGPPADPKLLNFLYDIRQAAGKMAFFDVQIDVACKLEPQPSTVAEYRTFDRAAHDGAIEYTYHVPRLDPTDPATVQRWLSGSRDPRQLKDRYVDNGTFVTVHGDNEGRNALTRLAPNVEGQVDVIYGPYLIKAGGEDGFLTLDLTAPPLDSAMQTAATAIDAQRKATDLNEAEVARPVRVIGLPASSATLGASAPIPGTTKLPPLPGDAGRPFPPVPPPLSLPVPAALPPGLVAPARPGSTPSAAATRQAAAS